MNYTNIRNVDLNLLVAFNALMEERSVTGAARRLFLSQPAMSHAIDRLQNAFKDELFIRTGKGYQPTRRALTIHAELQQMLPKIDALFGEAEFNPAVVTEAFRIEATDWGATVIMPNLIQILAKKAPGIRVDVIPTRIGFERLEANEVDLVLAPGLAPNIGSSGPNEALKRESLMHERVVCLARAGHPLARRSLTLREYVKARHILLTPMQGRSPSSSSSMAERQPSLAEALAELGQDLDVRVRVPYFVPLCLIVENTDLIATVPYQVARRLKTPKTRIIAAPREFRSYSYDQIWHSRNESVPLHKWIRGIVRSLGVQAATNRFNR
jgi:DNA-binding transcriptional LysR family regulator